MVVIDEVQEDVALVRTELVHVRGFSCVTLLLLFIIIDNAFFLSTRGGGGGENVNEIKHCPSATALRTRHDASTNTKFIDAALVVAWHTSGRSP